MLFLVLLMITLPIQFLRQGKRSSTHNGHTQTMPDSGDVHRGDHGAPAGVRPARVPVEMSAETANLFGIRTEKVRCDTISESIRAVATVVPDESRVSHVHTKIEGWLEELYVRTTGQQVAAGSPLAGIFSQELFASQAEYLAALKAARAGSRSIIVTSARDRLKTLGMPESEIREIERSGSPKRLVTLVSPRSGAVISLNVVRGMTIDPSMELMTVADLSTVWILAEIPETQKSAVRVGTPAIVDVTGSGGILRSKVEFIYPILSENTRTLRIRIHASNPAGTLKPGAYGTAELRVRSRIALTVSRDAVIDTGDRQYVFILTKPGQYEPRPVSPGVRQTNRVEIEKGLCGGDQVVSSGVFLIDSESRLRASGGAGAGHGGHGTQEATPKRQQPAPEPTAPSGDHRGH